MRLAAPLLLIALLAAPSAGQAPDPAPRPTRIVLPDAILPYRLVRIAVEGDFDSAAIFLEPAAKADTEDGADGRSTVMTGPPGEYTVQVVTITNGGKTLRKARASFVIPGVAPTPTPDPVPPDDSKPKPPPKPDPVPVVTGHLFATYIVDATAFTPGQAAMKRSTVIDAGLKPLDASYRWYQSDESEIQPADPSRPNEYHNNLISHVKPGELPVLLIQSPDGKIVEKVKAPTEADVVAAVKKLRGAQ